MHHATIVAPVALVAIGFLAPVAASAQDPVRSEADGAAEWTLPRTPDGRPDLQGYWTTQTFTPLERPAHLGDREFFTEEETAWLAGTLTAEGVDPSAREILTLIDVNDRQELERYKFQGNRTPDERHHIHYDNEIWLRTPVPKGLSSRRTSLITYPRNGRIPPRTPGAAARAAAATAAQARPGAFDSHETRPLSERCLAWSHEGPPMMPPSYNDIHQIFQTRDHVVVFSELSTYPPRIIRSTGARTSRTRFGSSPATRAGAGMGIRWSSRPETTPSGDASEDPAAPSTSWNALRASAPIGFTTSSRSPIRRRGRASGARRSRW